MNKIFILKLLFLFLLPFTLYELNAQCSSCKDSNCSQNVEAETEDDEFEEFEEFEEFTEEATEEELINYSRLKFPVLGVLFTILAGVFVKFKTLRNYRKLFLFLSMIFFGFHGFYAGPCICPIGDFQNLFIFTETLPNYLIGISFIILLLIATFFFGKTWCGWVCHLGGFQEFLFTKNKFKVLKSERIQKIMRWLRIVLVIIIGLHAAIYQMRTFCDVDPFKAIFGFEFRNTLSIILSIVVIILSIFIYRPFCRAACPIGVLLGLVSKLPFSRQVIISPHTPEQETSACKACSTSCEMQAITVKEETRSVDASNCIACGNCLSKCPKQLIELTVKR